MELDAKNNEVSSDESDNQNKPMTEAEARKKAE